MTTHYDDEAQVEALRRWWKENWLALLSGLVLGLAVIFGWQQWGRGRELHARQASQMFEELKQALQAKKSDAAETIGKTLIADFADTPYAAAAQLQLAQDAIAANRLDEASGRLQWVITFESKGSLRSLLARNLPIGLSDPRDPGLLDLARLRLARVYWQLGKSDDALRQLHGNAAAFDALYAELRGDILLARGERKAARDAYEMALQGLADDAAARSAVQQKVDSLADAAGTQAS